MSDPPLKKLEVNWCDLETAFSQIDDFGVFEQHSYLNTKNGNIIVLDDYITGLVDGIFDELADAGGDGEDWTIDDVTNTDSFKMLSETEQKQVLGASELHFGDVDHYESIPHIDSHESFRFMERFIETVDDQRLRKRLGEALTERKPFRRFRDVLAGERRVQRAWHAFETECVHDTILEWLHSVGVEPKNQRQTVDPPPLPELRPIMLSETQWFVEHARKIAGVQKIALIGSLTTSKEFPKDVDLLVTVSDDCEFTTLAELGRKLAGHLIQHQAGADVFLADVHGEYLGRTCPWRQCGPGYRRSCDADHCGRRPYLHDDFSSVRLKPDVIAQPPVGLWPKPWASDDVPADVRDWLVNLSTD